MKNKTCPKCRNEKSLNQFPMDNKKKGTVGSWCNECKREYNKVLYKKHPESFKASVKKWESKNKEKARAYQRIRYAIETGKMIKPKSCSKCGKGGRIEAHHWKGYDKAHVLDVQWLCTKCHRAL